ncbi:hypothetical protein JKG47_17740 [Acidithiobacillus sp. MC6.1]|nr:hypothetical protein [Acidithiobacillus sp. MC6.1]
MSYHSAQVTAIRDARVLYPAPLRDLRVWPAGTGFSVPEDQIRYTTNGYAT